jgi:acetyltransferase
MAHILDKILNPQSIAFLGASNSITTMGTGQLYVLKSRFQGRILPVHPSDEKVLGLPAYKSLEELPIVPDLLIIVLPTQLVADYLDRAGKMGIPYSIIVSAGFSEVGKLDDQENLNKIAQKYGMRFIGPNCIGIINLHCPNGIVNCTWFPFELPNSQSGNISIVSQSGSWISQILIWADRRGLRIGKAISIGNEANVDITDCLDYFRQDPLTKVVCVYLEGVKSEGRRFISSLRELAKQKPVVINYVGGTEAGLRAGMSHTASLGGKPLIYDTIINHTGAIRANTMEELYEFVHAFSMIYPPKGARIGLITNSGGAAVTLADSCEKNGLKVPEFSKDLQEKIRDIIPPVASPNNPVDVTFDMNFDLFFHQIPQFIWESGEVDALLLYGLYDSSMMTQMIKFANNENAEIFPLTIMDSIQAEILEKFVKWVHKEKIPMMITCLDTADEAEVFLQNNDIPVFKFPSMTARAMKAVVSYYTKEKNL